jgi:outer membrane protein
MHRIQSTLALLCTLLLLAPASSGQVGGSPGRTQVEMPPLTRDDSGFLGHVLKTYRTTDVAPINLSNSNRLEQLLRGGNIYLSLQDSVALALENNIDIELQRYGALEQDANILRARAGGALRGATPAVQTGPVSAAAAAVGISQSAGATAATTAINSQGALVQQTGSAILNYDPTVTGTLQFGHLTTPQNISIVSGVIAQQQQQDLGQFSLSQGFDTGTSYNLGYTQFRYAVNSGTFTYNPYLTGTLGITITQRLLQGFGRALNDRNIVIAKHSREQADLQFKLQVITTVNAVLDLYWDLVTFLDNVKSNQQSLAYNERLYSDNKRQVEVGTLAPIAIVQAEAAVATAQQSLIVAQTLVLQQETLLKSALSRNGVQSPALVEAHIIPTDRIRIPDVEPIQPYQDAVAMALSARPELAQQRIGVEINRVNARGSKAELLPTLNAFVSVNNNALAGLPNAIPNPNGPTVVSSSAIAGATRNVNPFFVGGAGNLLGQIFNRNFPDYSVGLNLTIPLRNRAAQADYVLDQLTIRESQLTLQRLENTVRQEVQNAIIGVTQARVGYQAAVKARILQEQTLDAEQKKLNLGASTIFNVILVQRDLANAQSTEVGAADVYQKSVVELDRATGRTLDKNSISIGEAFKGAVSRPPSPIPGGSR